MEWQRSTPHPPSKRHLHKILMTPLKMGATPPRCGPSHYAVSSHTYDWDGGGGERAVERGQAGTGDQIGLQKSEPKPAPHEDSRAPLRYLGRHRNVSSLGDMGASQDRVTRGRHRATCMAQSRRNNLSKSMGNMRQRSRGGLAPARG